MNSIPIRDWANLRPREVRLLLEGLTVSRAQQVLSGFDNKQVTRMRTALRKVLLERKHAAIARLSAEVDELNGPNTLELLDESAGKPPASKGLPAGMSLQDAVSAYERHVISASLEKARGNQSKTARILGTTRRILGYKMMLYGIDAKQFKRRRR